MSDHCRICGTDLGAGYLCDDCDRVVIERQHNPTDTVVGLEFYFGAASGSARKALRELQEPNVMLNYATKLNQPWYGIEQLFIDSGGYSFILGKGEYETTDAAYLDYVAEHDPDWFALRDYPCEPAVLDAHDRTVADHQHMTTGRHIDLLDALEDRSLAARPVAVVQGWTPQQYVEHLDALRDHGLLTDRVAIGSVCGRDAQREIRSVVLAVRDALPDRCEVHAFGVKEAALRLHDVREALDAADSQSYDMAAQWASLQTGGGKTWEDSALAYLKQKHRIREAVATDDRQRTLTEAFHE